ncbi:MAG: Cholera toxin secretion protein epsL [Pseudomonadota bacterium]|jgi:general secretion pathway protein L
MTTRRQPSRLRLKRDQAIVWLPPRSVGERALAATASLLLMRAGAARAGGPGVEGPPPVLSRASLESLPDLRSVYLVFDARDVSVLSTRLPRLPSSRLIRALPGLLEDQVLQDPAQCAWALDPLPTDQGDRRVGVIDAAWLETVAQAFERRRIKILAAWPMQAVMRPPSGQSWLLALPESLAWCAGDGEGLGWSPAATDDDRRVQVHEACSFAAGLDQPVSCCWMGGPGWVSALEGRPTDAVDAGPIGRNDTPEIQALSWPTPTTLDLMSARHAQGRLSARFGQVDGRAWRPAGAWAGLALLIALLGLNLEWARLAAEERQLNDRLAERFARIMGPATPRVDPVLQLSRHLAAARLRAGQADPEGFVPMLSKFAEALGATADDSLLGLQFREGRMTVRLRPQALQATTRDRLVEALRLQGLEGSFEPGPEGVLVVRALR